MQFDRTWQFAHFYAAVGPYGRRLEVEVGFHEVFLGLAYQGRSPASGRQPGVDNQPRDWRRRF
jgi:hypothetical protein